MKLRGEAAILLSFTWGDFVAGFIAPALAGWQSTSSFCSTSKSCPKCSTSGAATVDMMAGFGQKKGRETKPTVGAGKWCLTIVNRQLKSFKNLGKDGAEILDVYLTEAERQSDKFIFAGKLARKDGVSVEQALQWQRDLIVGHVKSLEPSFKTPMRIFTAPGDSEIEVARNVHDLTWSFGGKGSVDVSEISYTDVGFSPEIYPLKEPYFYVRKREDGTSHFPPTEVTIKSMDSMVEAGMLPTPSSPDSAPPAA